MFIRHKQNDLKSLRNEKTYDGEVNLIGKKSTPFISKIREGLYLDTTFGNDRTPFYSQFERDSGTRTNFGLNTGPLSP